MEGGDFHGGWCFPWGGLTLVLTWLMASKGGGVSQTKGPVARRLFQRQRSDKDKAARSRWTGTSCTSFRQTCNLTLMSHTHVYIARWHEQKPQEQMWTLDTCFARVFKPRAPWSLLSLSSSLLSTRRRRVPPRAPMLNSHTLCRGYWQIWLPPSDMAAPMVLTAAPGGKYWN